MSVPGEFPAPGELLPHRPPMLLIGKVLSHEPQGDGLRGPVSAPISRR